MSTKSTVTKYGADIGNRHGPKECVITKGGVDTPVEGFHGNITTSAPFAPTYGSHKNMGSQMVPVKKGGRGVSPSFRNKLYTGGN